MATSTAVGESVKTALPPEREITIDPYLPREREPTDICAGIHDPTDVTRTFTVTYSVAHFGIGMPFTTSGILTPTGAEFIRFMLRARRVFMFHLPSIHSSPNGLSAV